MEQRRVCIEFACGRNAWWQCPKSIDRALQFHSRQSQCSPLAGLKNNCGESGRPPGRLSSVFEVVSVANHRGRIFLAAFAPHRFALAASSFRYPVLRVPFFLASSINVG